MKFDLAKKKNDEICDEIACTNVCVYICVNSVCEKREGGIDGCS